MASAAPLTAAGSSAANGSALDKIRPTLRSNLPLVIVLAVHSFIVCASLVRVSAIQSYILFNKDLLPYAILAALALSAVSLLFVAARFSFGYFIGLYSYSMILGFVWIDVFSKYTYDRPLAGLSAAASLVLFVLPALFIIRPMPRAFTLSAAHLEWLLNAILLVSVATIVIAATYNFRLVSLSRIYDFRNELEFPAPIRYLLGITSSTLLTFAFACYWALNRRWRAALVLVLLLAFYPVTLTKFSFFTPAWLIALVVLAKLFETRMAAVLSLSLPMAAGLIMILALGYTGGPLAPVVDRYFDLVNIRMIATPSSALDIYNEFFSYHPYTYFCHISFLKTLTHCPYQEPLSVVMNQTYGFGNLNASPFATEGIASVGPFFAPLTALAYGFIIALGNRMSAGLPSRFVLISSGVLPHVLINTPLTVSLLTHGMAFLFLLWYVTPRDIFEQQT